MRIYHRKEWLVEKYEVDKWSQNEIAAFCGVTQSTIHKWMKIHSIKSRDMIECHLGERNGSWIESPIKDYHWAYQKYVKEGLTLRQITNHANCSLRTVARWLEKHNIETRKGAESFIQDRTGKNNSNWKGKSQCPNCGRKKSTSSSRCQFCHFKILKQNPEQNPNFKGVADFNSSLRSYIRSSWNPLVLNRDENKCVECKSEKDLNVHHIVPFSVIRDQILLENAGNLRIQELQSRLELLAVAKKDVRINDIDNGITLCKSCHAGEHRRIRHDCDEQIYCYYADVLEVQDGDSISARIDLGFNLFLEEDIRLYGIDTQELSSKDLSQKALAMRAKDIVESICLPGRRIVIRTFKAGKYGRWLAMLILPVGVLNGYLVDKDLAVEYYGD